MKGVEAPPIGGLVRVIVVVLTVLFAGWLLLAWAIVKRPLFGIPIALFTGLVLLVGMHDAQALAIYLLGVLWIWRRAHRASFDRLVGRRVRSRWVRWWTYERHWRNTMLQSGLGVRTRVRESVPKIQTVTSTRWGDRVLVRMLLGQCTEDYERAAPELGTASAPRPAGSVRTGPAKPGLSSQRAIRSSRRFRHCRSPRPSIWRRSRSACSKTASRGA